MLSLPLTGQENVLMSRQKYLVLLTPTQLENVKRGNVKCGNAVSNSGLPSHASCPTTTIYSTSI